MDVTFKGYVFFDEATFVDNALFNGVTFESTVWFRDKAEKRKYKFYRGLKFSHVEFKKGIEIDIPSECFKLPKAEAEACRVQRISYEKEGRRDDADRMFVRERRALRRSRVEEAKEELNYAERLGKSKLKAVLGIIKACGNLLKAECGSIIEYLLADLTCKYGTSWKRPVVLWMFVVFVLSPVLYMVSGLASGGASANLLDYLHLYLECLYFSLSNVTPFSYREPHPLGASRAIAAAEAIFGTFMWAVFLAVFARKYMR